MPESRGMRPLTSIFAYKMEENSSASEYVLTNITVLLYLAAIELVGDFISLNSAFS